MTQKNMLRRKRFAEEYLKDGNITQASIRAGLPNHTEGWRLLKEATVQKEISDAMKLSNLSPEWILSRVMALATDGKTDHIQLKALELLAKHKGLLIERMIHTHDPEYILTDHQSQILSEPDQICQVRRPELLNTPPCEVDGRGNLPIIEDKEESWTFD